MAVIVKSMTGKFVTGTVLFLWLGTACIAQNLSRDHEKRNSLLKLLYLEYDLSGAIVLSDNDRCRLFDIHSTEGSK